MQHNFQNLNIWTRSRQLTKDIYTLSQRFPAHEQFCLTTQLRKSAISVPPNIAEGCGRGSASQLAYFLDVAIGSLCELETQCYLAFDLYYLSSEDLELVVHEITEIRRMILRFKSNLLG